MKRSRSMLTLASLLGVSVPAAGWGQTSFPPITSRDFNIDLFELSFAGDIARDYKNAGLSLGFWN